MSQNTFFQELKRRDLYKVASIYAVSAWVLIQVVVTIFPIFDIPMWFQRLVVVLAIVGFPITMIVNWMKAGKSIAESEGGMEEAPTKFSWYFYLMMSIVLIVLIAIGIRPLNKVKSKKVATTSQAEISKNSLAVLPFENIMKDAENQYFTDGMHDDLLVQLSKIGSLKVIARSSVIRFKDGGQSITQIAKMLGVANILEGSIRRQGDRVRINVKLIKADGEVFLWAENYDRILSTQNILEIQSEIAREIAAQLKATITPNQENALTSLPTSNLEAYENYLKARQLMEVRNANSLYEAKSLFEQSIALDPQFALAYIHLGGVHALLPFYANADGPTNFEIGWGYMEKGMQINNQLAEAYALKGYLIYCIEKDLEKAEPVFKQAIAINPNYETTYLWYAFAVRNLTLDFEKALEIHQKALQLNPLSPAVLANYTYLLEGIGNFKKAIEVNKKGTQLESAYPFFWGNLSSIFRRHFGQLDSAAIYAFQGMQNNGPNDRFLHDYLYCLESLGMFNEIEVLLANSKMETKQDSIIHLRYQTDLAFLRNDYKEIRDLEEILQPFGKWENRLNVLHNIYFNGPDIEMASYFYQRKFSKVIGLFEANYPMVNKEKLKSINQRVFLEYLFCLKKTGQSKKLETLWSLYNQESKTFEWNRCFDKVLAGNFDEAIIQLHQMYDEQFYFPWPYVDHSPIMDELRDNPRYIETLNKIKLNVERQRDSFKTFLSTQNKNESD